MPRCLKCAQVVDRDGALCIACESEAAALAPAPTPDAVVSDVAGSPGEPASERPAPERRAWHRRHTWAAASAGAGAAVIALAVVGTGARDARGVPAAVEQASIVSVTPASGLPA